MTKSGFQSPMWLTATPDKQYARMREAHSHSDAGVISPGYECASVNGLAENLQYDSSMAERLQSFMFHRWNKLPLNLRGQMFDTGFRMRQGRHHSGKYPNEIRIELGSSRDVENSQRDRITYRVI